MKVGLVRCGAVRIKRDYEGRQFLQPRPDFSGVTVLYTAGCVN